MEMGRQVGTLASAALLTVLGALLFVGVAYVPGAVTDDEGRQALVGSGLRLLGFAALLAAGALVVRRQRSG